MTLELKSRIYSTLIRENLILAEMSGVHSGGFVPFQAKRRKQDELFRSNKLPKISEQPDTAASLETYYQGKPVLLYIIKL